VRQFSGGGKGELGGEQGTIQHPHGQDKKTGGDKMGVLLLGGTIFSMVGGGIGYYYHHHTQERAAGKRPGLGVGDWQGLRWERGSSGTDTDSGEKKMGRRGTLAPSMLEFDHPLNAKPLAVRCWVMLKRVCWLGLVFTPLAFWSAVLVVHKTERMREFWVKKLVETLEAAGCSFQKFGQWMSMRPDMLPPDVIDALSKLRMDGWCYIHSILVSLCRPFNPCLSLSTTKHGWCYIHSILVCRTNHACSSACMLGATSIQSFSLPLPLSVSACLCIAHGMYVHGRFVN
jgi:hypothetical protein